MVPSAAAQQQDSNAVRLSVQPAPTSAKVHTIKPHSAKKALILSAILPGAGQVYNGQAWKIPIIYGALGGVAYYSYSNYKEMKLFRDEYLYRVTHDDTPLLEGYADRPTTNIYNLYESYNKTFQLSVIISVALYGVNLLDAYVFGHLYDFQITDDLSLHIAPTVTPQAFGSELLFVPSASFTLRF